MLLELMNTTYVGKCHDNFNVCIIGYLAIYLAT